MTESNKAYNALQNQKSKCIICVSAPCSFSACSLCACLRKAQTLETSRNLLGENVSWKRCFFIRNTRFFIYLFTSIFIKIPTARALHGALPSLHGTITLSGNIFLLLPSHPHVDQNQEKAFNILPSSSWPLNLYEARVNSTEAESKYEAKNQASDARDYMYASKHMQPSTREQPVVCDTVSGFTSCGDRRQN